MSQDSPNAASTLLSLAEQHLDADNFAEALKVATEAHQACKDSGDLESLADASRLMVNAHCGLEDRKAANQFAKEMLEHFRSVEAAESSQAKMLLSIAEVNYDKRGSKNREIAKESALQALAMFQQRKESNMEAATLLVLCNITLKDKSGSKDIYGQKARDYASKAQELHKSTGNRKKEALAFHSIGVAYAEMQNVKWALEASNEALKIFRDLGDKKLEAFELQCAAMWQSDSQPEAALASAEAALAASREVDGKDHGLEASALGTLVRIQKESDPDAAIKTARKGVQRFRELEDKQGEAQAMISVASANRESNPSQALAMAERSQAAFKALGDSRSEQMVQRFISELQLQVHNGDQALDSALQSLTKSQESNDKREIASSMFSVARVYLARSGFEKVQEYADNARSLCSEAEWRNGEAEALVMSSKARAGMQDLNGSLAAAAEAQDILKILGDRSGEASLVAMICEINLLKEDFEAAIVVAQRLRDESRQCENVGMEVNASLLAARASVKKLKKLVEDGGSMSFSDAGYKAARSFAHEALTLARLMRDRSLVAAAQYIMAQIFMLSSDAEAALGASIESATLAKKSGDLKNEASALQLSAEAHLALKEMDEAWESSAKALNLHRKAGNRKGVEGSAKFLEQIAPHWQRKNEQKQSEVAEKTEAGPVSVEDSKPSGGLNKDLSGRSAVDLSGGVTEELIQAKMFSVLEENLGLDTDEFEVDEPLMQSGITSGGAMLLQSAMSVDFPTVKVPPTLIFDYPSMRAVVGFIYDSLKS